MNNKMKYSVPLPIFLWKELQSVLGKYGIEIDYQIDECNHDEEGLLLWKKDAEDLESIWQRIGALWDEPEQDPLKKPFPIQEFTRQDLIERGYDVADFSDEEMYKIGGWIWDALGSADYMMEAIDTACQSVNRIPGFDETEE